MVMDAKIKYSVINCPVTAEEIKRYGFSKGTEQAYFLVRETYLNNSLLNQERITYFNFDSEAQFFADYLKDLEEKVKGR